MTEMELARLREAVMDFITGHFDAVSKTPGFASLLPRDTILEVLARR